MRKKMLFAALAAVGMAALWNHVAQVPAGATTVAGLIETSPGIRAIEDARVSTQPVGRTADRLGRAVSPRAGDPQWLPQAYADNEVLAQVDHYLERLRANLDLSDDERFEFQARLERTVQTSDVARSLLARRLATAFAQGDALAIFELERGFNTSVEGLSALKEVYAAEVARKGPFDYYALQGLATFQGHLDDAQRLTVMESAFDQMLRYPDINQYGGALQYLTNALGDPLNAVPAAYRDMGTRLIQQRLQSAQSYEEQLFTAQSMFRLLPAPQNAALAEQLLVAKPTAGNFRAVLEALDVGTLRMNNGLRGNFQRAAAQVPLSPEDQALVARLLGAPVPLGG